MSESAASGSLGGRGSHQGHGGPADGWRLAVGLLTAWPVRPPAVVGATTARWAMLLAPLAVLPLGAAAAALAWGGREAGLAPLAVGLLVVGALALGSRAFHVDGLADTADGLTASYDRERTLAIMRSGDVGPAGAATLVVVLGLQAAGVAALLASTWGPVLVGVAVLASRASFALLSARPVPDVPGQGLGSLVVGSVPVAAAGLPWLLATVALCLASAAADVGWWRGAVASAVALLVLAVLLRRCLRRVGGVTGDVLGAGAELSLAALLVSLS